MESCGFRLLLVPLPAPHFSSTSLGHRGASCLGGAQGVQESRDRLSMQTPDRLITSQAQLRARFLELLEPLPHNRVRPIGLRS